MAKFKCNVRPGFGGRDRENKNVERNKRICKIWTTNCIAWDENYLITKYTKCSVGRQKLNMNSVDIHEPNYLSKEESFLVIT